MPENPNSDPLCSGDNNVDGPGRTMSVTNITLDNNSGTSATSTTNNTNNNRNNNNNSKRLIPRVSSAELKYYDIATQLLGKAGSDLEELFIAAARDGVYERIENFLFRRSEAIVSIDVKERKTGNTPLIWAAKRGHVKIVQLLLRHSADITLRNYEGQTAAEVASPSIRAVLLDSVERSTEASHQLLLQASWQGDIKVVTRLLRQNKVLDVNCQNADGFTPLMLATRDMHLFEKYSAQMTRTYNPLEVVAELLAARADIHATDSDGKTCLHHACQSKAIIANSMVQTIIAGRPDLEGKDKRCFTPIHCACLTGNVDCIGSLLGGGSEVNSRGFAGATPLHITAYNNHERATTLLLENGANVTLTDDRGLTPLDFAKSRKIKNKLKEAWTEATSRKSTTSLGPIRAPSREDLRSSLEDLTKRRKGEVIFDGIPANPFSSNASKQDTLSSSRGLTRHQSLKDKGSRGEDVTSRDADNGTGVPHHVKDGMRRLGQVRQQRPTPLPRTKSRSTERLPAISPDRSLTDRNLESPTSFNRFSRSRRSLDEKKGANGGSRGRKVAPMSREGTVHGDDVFDRLTPGPSPTPSSKGNAGSRHKRSGSDPFGSPSLADLAMSCEQYFPSNRRGRSLSVSSNTVADGATPESPRQTQARMVAERENTLLSVCSCRSESRLSVASNSPRILNLGQMGLLSKTKTPVSGVPLYPTSNRVLPPTPTFITQRGRDGISSKEQSPRSDEEELSYMANLQNPSELLRSHTTFKEEFILEETRPKDPFIQSSSSSNTDTVSSSGSSHLSSPRDTPTKLTAKLKPTNLEKSVHARNAQKLPQKTDESGNKGFGFMNISKQKVTEKSVPRTPVSVSTVQKANDSSKSGTKATKEKLSAAASGSGVSTRKGASPKAGGKIIIHGVVSDKSKNCDLQAGAASTGNGSSKTAVQCLTGGPKQTQLSGNSANTLVEVTADKVTVSEVQDITSPPEQSQAGLATSKMAATSEPSPAKPVTSTVKTMTSSAKDRRSGQTGSLHVVPTKLTANLVRTAPKGGSGVGKRATTVGTGNSTEPEQSVKQSSDQLKTSTASDTVVELLNSMKESSKEHDCTAVSTKQLVDMSLNQSASFVKPEDKAGAEAKPATETKAVNQSATQRADSTVKIKDKTKPGSQALQQTVNKPGSHSTSAQLSTRTQTNNRNTNQTSSAQAGNRQGAMSRNSNFNVSRSAGAGQRQPPVSRKNTPYTPRFPSQRTVAAAAKPSSGTAAVKTDKESKGGSDRKPADTKGAAHLSAQTEVEVDERIASQSGDPLTKNGGSGSPVEVGVNSGVCKSTSLSKSYNMAPQNSSTSSLAGSASNTSTARGSVQSKSAGAVLGNKSNNGYKPTSSSNAAIVMKQDAKKGAAERKAVLSKSVGSPATATATVTGRVTSTSIVSKSTSQMPSVGQTLPDKSPHGAGLARSASMSVIEEALEDKTTPANRKNSSDIPLATPKPRPSSDGPAGATSSDMKVKPVKSGTAPLVEILPQGTPRVSKNRYVDTGPMMHTPVIVNPFEELEQKREQEKDANLQKLGRGVSATEFRFVVEKPERSKTQVSMKSRNIKSAKKPVSKETKQTRVTSGKTRNRKKTKDVKTDDAVARPRSGKGTKRQRSGKKRRKVPEDSALSKQAEKPDVALIGGIGWHMATSCKDKNEDEVIVSQIDSSGSEDEAEDLDVVCVSSPENAPDSLQHITPQAQLHLHLQPPLELSSAASSPRFMEVKPSFQEKVVLPSMADDGFPPMNLDMTQGSQSKIETDVRQNDLDLADQNLPDDIRALLSQLQRQEESDSRETTPAAISHHELTAALNREILMRHLTPIPESPSLTQSHPSLQLVSKTVQAITKFDGEVQEDHLNQLLGATPRDSTSGVPVASNKGHTDSYQGGLKSGGRSVAGRVSDSHQFQKQSNTEHDYTPVQQISLNSKSKGSRNNSLRKNSGSNKSLMSESRESEHDVQSQRASGNPSRRNSGARMHQEATSGADSNAGNVVTVSEMRPARRKSSDSSSGSVPEVKQADNQAKLDLKTLLTEKMQSTQKLLGESVRARSGASTRSVVSHAQDNVKVSPVDRQPDLDINVCELEDDAIVINLDEKGLDTSRTETDELKSTRSSRKERRFSETKTNIPDEADNDDNMDEAIKEIMGNTYPSSKSRNSTLKSRNMDSLRSASNTLTEGDRSVLKQLASEYESSPFHARQHNTVRASSSYDETLNQDNPDLMKRFHASHLQMGQRVKAMIEAGADKSKVKAMLQVDNEAKQLARIMNSFRQMELYAGPSSNKSAKKDTPRHGNSLKLDLTASPAVSTPNTHSVKPPSGRPGSAGAGKLRPGKFTEIKQVGQSTSQADPVNQAQLVPKDLEAEFKRSPFVEVNAQQAQYEDLQQLDDLAQAMRGDSPDYESDSSMERCDSACTSISSQSALEETIQWKKGNVLGKGAFGTVWCGLTSEGQLIAVKQIELNVANHTKAKREYEKVQEEVELLKTLEHKNIVGYMGTSLEDSIVSIFMQFIPGGSLASILARFGALDEAVFRRYTRQILEGVQYLHSNDVIHRDIKGGNVMLMPNGVIKLIDFGCAKRLCINLSMGQSQILKSMKGTPYWMAPEVVNETGHGKKSDIWSVGCTVFEMATRKPPWADMNPMAAIFAIGSDRPIPQLPDKFSEEARDFVNLCLTRDQNKRFSATELLQCPFIKRRGSKR